MKKEKEDYIVEYYDEPTKKVTKTTKKVEKPKKKASST